MTPCILQLEKLIMGSKILIIGACGQIGAELTDALREKQEMKMLWAADIRKGNTEMLNSGHFEIVDATNFKRTQKIVDQYEIEEVYLMAAMLSATAEKFPMKAWKQNMDSLFHVLNLARSEKI